MSRPGHELRSEHLPHHRTLYINAPSDDERSNTDYPDNVDGDYTVRFNDMGFLGGGHWEIAFVSADISIPWELPLGAGPRPPFHMVFNSDVVALSRDGSKMTNEIFRTDLLHRPPGLPPHAVENRHIVAPSSGLQWRPMSSTTRTGYSFTVTDQNGIVFNQFNDDNRSVVLNGDHPTRILFAIRSVMV